MTSVQVISQAITGDRWYNMSQCQGVACRVSGDNISSNYMTCDKVVAEHNQAELSKLECTDSKQYLTLSVWQGYRDNSA